MLVSCACLTVLALSPQLAAMGLEPGSSSQPPNARFSEGILRLEREFRLVPGEEGVWSAPNRTHALRARVSEEGLEVFPHETGANGLGAPWIVQIRSTAFGRNGNLEELCSPPVSVQAGEAAFDHGILQEWYQNREEGIEQGWTIPEPPPGAAGSPLRIEIEIRGLHASIDDDGRSAVLLDEGGRIRLGYEGLCAWDAAGRDLPTALTSTSSGLAVQVVDDGAIYPITIDPVLNGPDWTAEGNQVAAYFAWSVSKAGVRPGSDRNDVNGDGFDDVIVGAIGFSNGQDLEGGAFLYLGSPIGPSATSNWSAESDQAFAYFGWSVSSAGDVNGDGFDDVIVGAPRFANGQIDEGRAFLYLGSPIGPSATPNWSAESDQAVALFGWSVSSAGDVNGDGFDDVIVGAIGFNNGQPGEGRAFLYLGSAGGPSIAPDWTAESNQDGASFGISVSGAGDVNGDGFDDVIVGAFGFNNGQPGEGRAFLYLGSAGGLSLAPNWTAESDQGGAEFGFSVSGSGDVNGDGFDDVIVGAHYFDNGQTDEGRAFLYLGSAIGLTTSAAWMAESDQDAAEFGFSVSGSGDVNHDGFADVIVGAHNFSDGQAYEGGAFLYFGTASGLADNPDSTAGSDQVYGDMGHAVSGAGDVNGDGFDDVVVGAPQFSNGESVEGRAYVYLGQITDCNGNGIDDADDITSGTSQDCNHNAIPDECDIASGTSTDANENGIPDECEGIGTKYCVTTPNSTGAPADIFASGSASSIAGNLRLDSSPVPNGVGIFFHGLNQTYVPFGNGFRCVKDGIVRSPVVLAVGNVATYTYDNTDSRHSLAAFINTTRHFQYWFRDPMAPPAYYNTSNAISIPILP